MTAPSAAFPVARRDDLLRPEPRPWWQLLAGIVIYAVAQLAAGFVAGLFAVSAQGTMAGLAVAALLSIAGFLAVVPRLTGRPAYELRGPGATREFGLGLVLGAATMCLAVGVLAAVGSYRVVDVGLGSGIGVGLMIGVGAAFAEEIFFRGFLLRLLDKRFGSWPATIVVSLLFGAVHLGNPQATVWGAVAIVLAAGPLLCGAYLFTRRLWLPIGIHLSWNAVQSGVFGINVSGVGSGRGLIESELTGPAWLSGGSMGIEGSVVLVALALALGLGFLVLAQRRGCMLPRRRLTAAPDRLPA
ncbi:lysostaphin resistance A-like protein [Gordonia sp. (in: high G+C Gram-positive bacteria)]|uniref:CPBP family intramembrane glutamic endopeptidase n=1 Tax=Gordonia sp. (in: high G+C Gram-positive bacteria) TaxID=84139 RepID=UPI0039E52BDB